jgi:quinol monooxygenase YgiN
MRRVSRTSGGGDSVEKSVTVIAHIFAKAGEEQRLKRALLDLVTQTRKEKGCINYDLHQSQENACQFVMYENWESAADLDAHANSAHLREFGKSMGQFLERPTQITKWNMVSKPGNS